MMMHKKIVILSIFGVVFAHAMMQHNEIDRIAKAMWGISSGLLAYKMAGQLRMSSKFNSSAHAPCFYGNRVKH